MSGVVSIEKPPEKTRRPTGLTNGTATETTGTPPLTDGTTSLTPTPPCRAIARYGNRDLGSVPTRSGRGGQTAATRPSGSSTIAVWYPNDVAAAPTSSDEIVWPWKRVAAHVHSRAATSF